MKSKETKVFNIEGKEMRFNKEAFNQAILLFSRRQNIKIGKVEESLSEVISVNIETIRNWRKGANGPGSDAYIKEAASVLGVSDWTSLFTETDGGYEMNVLSNKQIEAVKRIYDACIEVLNHFLYIENVRSMVRHYELQKQDDPEFSVDNASYELSNRMFLVMDQEYFYLRNHEIYDELADYTVDVSNDVVSALHYYVEKPDQIESLFDTWSTPAADAMQKLNEIVDFYIPEGV